MVNNIILLEEYKKRIDYQEKLIAEQSFKINDLKDIIDRMNEDIENLTRTIKRMNDTTQQAVDSMSFKDDQKD
ncbi:hypothetical protein EBU71_05125 [bacterium]|nr:hypothetical protein [Candidatus Elulimicrobium humile]